MPTSTSHGKQESRGRKAEDWPQQLRGPVTSLSRAAVTRRPFYAAWFFSSPLLPPSLHAASRVSGMGQPTEELDFLRFLRWSVSVTTRGTSTSADICCHHCGMAAGIMGFTGLMGFAVFGITTMILSAMLYVYIGADAKPYFKAPNDLWTEGVSQAMMSYIMFWTLFYDIVHIY